MGRLLGAKFPRIRYPSESSFRLSIWPRRTFVDPIYFCCSRGPLRANQGQIRCRVEPWHRAVPERCASGTGHCGYREGRLVVCICTRTCNPRAARGHDLAGRTTRTVPRLARVCLFRIGGIVSESCTTPLPPPREMRLPSSSSKRTGIGFLADNWVGRRPLIWEAAGYTLDADVGPAKRVASMALRGRHATSVMPHGSARRRVYRHVPPRSWSETAIRNIVTTSGT